MTLLYPLKKSKLYKPLRVESHFGQAFRMSTESIEFCGCVAKIPASFVGGGDSGAPLKSWNGHLILGIL
jgi:hypothetical protein